MTQAATLAAAAGVVAQGAGATAASANVAALSAASGGTPAAAGGASITLGAVAQWVGIGLLGGLVTVPLVREALPEHEPKPLAPQQRIATPREQSTAEARKVPLAISTRSTNEPEPSKKLESRRAPAPTPAPAIEEPESLAPESTPGALLAAEVRFVDQGRAALKRGAPADTLTLLGPYEARFPRQQLLTEVLFLRMEAENRLGNSERARALAQRIIARGIAGPQAARARELRDR